MDKTSNNKRIAKNTMLLYVRMIVIMLVQLYTSRVILQTLGVEDYGIYNIVAAVVVSLTFITGPLSTATQRFLSFELGRKNTERIKDIFSMSLIVYAILSVLILIIAETVGLWFLNHKMDIPADRLYAANWVFQFSVMTFIINMLNIPFNAAIIAYEKMSFYAYVSIFEAIAKLAIVYFLLLYSGDQLILYGLLVMLVTLSVTSVYKIYCNKRLRDIKIKLVRDKALLKQLLSFSGWSLFGSVASMSADQGLNLLLNLFFGVTVNAAMGIAAQVSAAVNQFVMNFQTAFRPQLVKSYAEGNIPYLHGLIYKSSKFSYLLLFMVVCPILFNLDFILHLWLGDNVPEYAAVFCRLMLIYALIESLSGPFWMTVQATGRIKKYQLCISMLMFSNIVLSYFFLKNGVPPETVLIIKCCMAVLYFTIRIYFIKRFIDLPIKTLLLQTIIPILIISLITTVIIYPIATNYPLMSTIRFVCILSVFFPIYIITTYIIALNKQEKQTIKKFIKKLYA